MNVVFPAMVIASLLAGCSAPPLQAPIAPSAAESPSAGATITFGVRADTPGTVYEVITSATANVRGQAANDGTRTPPSIMTQIERTRYEIVALQPSVVKRTYLEKRKTVVVGGQEHVQPDPLEGRTFELRGTNVTENGQRVDDEVRAAVLAELGQRKRNGAKAHR